jgi:hypothetical protein
MIPTPGPPVFDLVWLEVPAWEVPAAFVVEAVLVAVAPAEPAVVAGAVPLAAAPVELVAAVEAEAALVFVAPVEPAVVVEVVLV